MKIKMHVGSVRKRGNADGDVVVEEVNFNGEAGAAGAVREARLSMIVDDSNLFGQFEAGQDVEVTIKNGS